MKPSKELGRKIRELRKSRGWTLKEMSSRLGVSVMTLQRAETAQVSPSVALLLDIARCLDKPVSYFLDEDKPSCRVFTKDDIEVIEEEGFRRVEFVTRGLVSNDISASLGLAEAGTTMAAREDNCVEATYVVDGDQELVYRGEIRRLGPGDTVCYDASFKHSTRFLSDSTVVQIKKVG